MKRFGRIFTAFLIFFMISASMPGYVYAAEHDDVPADQQATEETGENTGEGTEGEGNGETGQETAEGADTSSSAVTIDIGDGRFVAGAYPDDLMPALFHKDTIDFRGQTIECAKFDNADVTLVYTADASLGDPVLMLYDPVKDELSDVRIIRGTDNRFIIVLSDCDGDIPAGYTKAVLDWNGQTLTAFMEESVANGSATGSSGVDPADFFLVYAMSSEGNKGWYRYDKNENTYQRFLETSSVEVGEFDATSSDEEDNSQGLLDPYISRELQGILLIVCAPLALILLAVVIILAVRLHEYASDYGYYGDDMYDMGEYEDEDEEDDRAHRKLKPGAVTAASLVGRSFVEEDEEDDDDEDDEDEDDMEDDTDEEDDGDEDADDEDDEDEDDGEDEDEEDEDEDEDDEEDDEDREEPDDRYRGKVRKKAVSPVKELEDDISIYTKPMTKRERREMEREEKWRQKEEKKAAKRRMQGYEEVTPMDWSSFETGRMDVDSEKAYKKVNPPKYMTESLEEVPGEIPETKVQSEPVRKKKLPPRKVAPAPEEEPKPQVVQEEEMRQKQRRLFEQQQRIEEMRRIEAEQQEEQRRKEQQQFISARIEDDDLDEDFQFEFLKLD